MIVKIFFICVSTLFIQIARSQNIGRLGPNQSPVISGISCTVGGLPVTSASPYPPIGLTVISENTYEGTLNVGGRLPFLATVALEGVLPTVGSGSVSYACGDSVGMLDEGPLVTGIVPGLGGVPGVPGLGVYGYNGPVGYGLY